MEEELVSTDLFDILGKKHREALRAIEIKWNGENEIQLTSSDRFILDLINYKQETLANVCKNGEITRQGTHKLIKKLETEGLVKTGKLDKNKRNKTVQLTPLGISVYEKNRALRERFEEHIKHVLGSETYERLIKTLSADWHLNTDKEVKAVERQS